MGNLRYYIRNNRVFELDNTYKWEDCYGDEVLIPENQRTEDGDSPKEQLASLVKGGSNAKGYTLTEYINDINRENTEVLAEYGADEKIRQAYTYGESGIGERVSVDKSEESSYYLYDGRNSVTGILTENANLANSYQYDPHGHLTSGTADGVNYYGYNGESTNVKTGLQYLRARYYDAENGDFISEDEDLGDEEEPLTMNRYQYTTNNPVNYDDTTGNKKKAKNSKKSSKKSAKKSSKKSSVKKAIPKKSAKKKTNVKRKANVVKKKRAVQAKSKRKKSGFNSKIARRTLSLKKYKKHLCGTNKHVTKQEKEKNKKLTINAILNSMPSLPKMPSKSKTPYLPGVKSTLAYADVIKLKEVDSVKYTKEGIKAQNSKDKLLTTAAGYLPGVGTELGAIAGEVRKRNLKTNSNYTKESVKNIGYGVAKDKIIEAVDRKKLLVQ